jgi:pre-rRNA-processing protein TSR1
VKVCVCVATSCLWGEVSLVGVFLLSILVRQVHLTGYGDYQLEGIEQRDLVARDNGQRLRGRAGREAKAAASGLDGMVDEPAVASAAAAAATPVYAMRVASRPTADRESLVALLDLDPFATQNEQSVITDEEMQAAGASGSAPRAIMFSPARGPKARGDGAASSSAAAAAAAMDDAEDEDEEYDEEEDGDADDDDVDDDADMDAAMGVRSAATAAAQRSAGRSVSFAAEVGPASRSSGWGMASSVDATANEDADFADGDEDDGDDVGSRKLIEAEKARSLRLLERDEMEFPDEVETPLDISARERFARYRGLQNFKTSPWDPYESLPLEYGRIIQFEHFAATAKAVLQGEESLLRAALFSTGPSAPAAATSSTAAAAVAAGASEM